MNNVIKLSPFVHLQIHRFSFFKIEKHENNIFTLNIYTRNKWHSSITGYKSEIFNIIEELGF
jgi:hypothetical protein